jgi:hypothetical protein
MSANRTPDAAGAQTNEVATVIRAAVLSGARSRFAERHEPTPSQMQTGSTMNSVTAGQMTNVIHGKAEHSIEQSTKKLAQKARLEPSAATRAKQTNTGAN